MELNLLSMLSGATHVVLSVLGLLVLMSLISWALMLRKWLEIRSAIHKSSEGLERFDKARDLRAAVHSLGGDTSSPLYGVAHQGVAEFNRSKEAGNRGEIVVDNVRHALNQGVSTEMSHLRSSLPFLATTANTAPFIGLFGTVWGIMHSFHSIGSAKSASLATVAPGISEALIATAIGLAVAIPATVGYNAFQSQLETVNTLLVNFASSFLTRAQRELNANKPHREHHA